MPLINTKKILEVIDNDNHLDSIRFANSPKKFALYKIRDIISILLNKLYSVTDQITILSNTSSKFSITPDTYRLFLRNEMADEYRQFKINQIFLRKINQILKLATNENNLQKQFDLLFPVGLVIDKKLVSAEDYKFFVDNYIKIPLQRKKVFIESKEIKYELRENTSTNHLESVAIPAPPATTIHDILNEPKNEENELKNATENINTKYNNLYEQETSKLNILPNISVDNIPIKYEILTNRFKHPSEIKLFAETDNITFNEEFVYIFNRELLHAVDLNEFCKDNILVVCGTSYDEEYRSGYVLYRWYKGKLYFIEHYELLDFGASFERQTRMWMDEHYSSALDNFIWEKWCDYKLALVYK